MKMADIYAGKMCGECHNGKRAFKPAGNCAKCHKK
jgi:c(7)-type cytochrome triheme protein